MTRNQRISREDLDAIRVLDDFDLTMLISEINDGGWPAGKKLLSIILKTVAKVHVRHAVEKLERGER